MPTELVVNTAGGDEALQPGVDDRFARHNATAKRRRGVPSGVLRLVGPLAVLAIWCVASGSGALQPQILPAPWTVAETGVDLITSGQLGSNLLTSAERALSGLVIGVVVGVLLALLAGLSRVGESLLDTNMQILRSLPILALMPLALVWLGIGETMKVSLIALGVLFPIYLNTHAAIRGTDVRNLDLARTVGLSQFQLVRHVVLPGALPGFFTGLRFSTAIAWLILVVVEQTNASSGIGYLMIQARGIGRTDIIIVGLVVYAVLGVLSDTLVRLAERKTLAWRSTR